jgi:hypothetical protein
MAAAAAFQIQLPAGSDGLGLTRYGILQIFLRILVIGRLRQDKGHTE